MSPRDSNSMKHFVHPRSLTMTEPLSSREELKRQVPLFSVLLRLLPRLVTNRIVAASSPFLTLSLRNLIEF